MDYKEKKEMINSGLCRAIIGTILLIVALCFLPLATIEGEFVYNTFEAIFMYLIFAAASIFYILSIVKFVQLIVKLKKSKK